MIENAAVRPGASPRLDQGKTMTRYTTLDHHVNGKGDTASDEELPVR